MMIVDVEQGTREWLAARAGVVTASCLDKIITPKTMKASGSQAKYLARLLAEYATGQPIEDDKSAFMQRGSHMESEAVAWYEFEKDAETRKVGFCLRDDGKVGCSPDRLVGEYGLLEIKVPGAETHAANLIDHAAFIEDHRCQIQGQLWITGRQWLDLVSFNPVMPPVCVRIIPDQRFVDALAPLVDGFLAKLEEAKAKLEPARQKRMETVAAAQADDSDIAF